MKPSISYGDSHFPFIEKDKFNFKLLENVNTEGKELKFGKNVNIEYQIYELKPLDKNLNIFLNQFRITQSYNTDENQYLNLIKDVLSYGSERQTRNAKVYSLFSKKWISISVVVFLY